MDYRETMQDFDLTQLMAAFKASPPPNDEFSYYLDVAGLVSEAGQDGIEFMFEYYDDAVYSEQKSAILLQLSRAWQHTPTVTIDDGRLRGLLVRAMRSEDEDCMATALKQLWVIGETSVASEVIMLLSHPLPAVRSEAARYLTEYPSTMPPLIFTELTRQFEAVPDDPDDEHNGYYYTEYHHHFAALIKFQGQVGIDYLFNAFGQSDDQDQQRAIVFILTWPTYCKLTFEPVEEKRLSNLLHEALQPHKPDGVIREAIDSYRHLERADMLDEIMPLLEHSSEHVQSGVLHYLKALYPDIAFPILIRYLTHPHYILRMVAVDKLDEMYLEGEQKALVQPIFEKMLETEPHEYVQQALRWAIDCMNGVI